MSLFRFNIPAGSVDIRLAATGGTSGRIVGAKLMPTVNITDRTTIDTVDPITIAALDGLAAAGGMGPGSAVTISKGLTGTRTVDYDAATAAVKAGR